MKRDRNLLRALTLVIWAGLIVDAVIILWGSRRGFDLTDEGYYWLNYAYSGYYPISSGFIFLGAKLVSSFHLDIVSLRWMRFLLLFAAHMVFAAAVVHWLTRSFSVFWESTWVKRFGFALLLASATMPYLWAPQTLSYNDWGAVFGLLIATAVLAVITAAENKSRSPLLQVVWLSVIVGFLLGWLAFAKWTSALGLGVLLGVVGLCRFGRRRLLAGYLFGIVGGLVMAGVCLHLFCIDLRVYYRYAQEAAVLVAQTTHRPGEMVVAYSEQFLHTHLRLLRNFWWCPLLLSIWPKIFYGTRRLQFGLARCCFIVGLFGAVVMLFAALDFFQAAGKTSRSLPGHLAIAGLVGAAWAACRFHGWRNQRMSEEASSPQPESSGDPAKNRGFWRIKSGSGLAGVVLLMGLPWAVAFGTGNHLLFPGAHLGVAWKGLFLAGFFAAWSYRGLRAWCLGLGLLSVVLSQAQFVDGYLIEPYRLKSSLLSQTQAVKILPRGSNLLFDSTTAAFLNDLTGKCLAAGLRPDQSIMAFYDLPGLPFLLGGVSPATPWYFGPEGLPDHARKSLATSGRQPIPGGDGLKPFVLTSQKLDLGTVKTLREIGVEFPDGYTNLGTFHEPVSGKDIALWAPK